MSNLESIEQDISMTPSVIVRMKRLINSLTSGKLNPVGTVTLTNGGTTTTLRNNAIVYGCVMFFWPQTAHAQAVSSSLWYDPTSIPTVGPIIGGSIILNHSSSAQADLTFGYVVFI